MRAGAIAGGGDRANGWMVADSRIRGFADSRVGGGGDVTDE